MRQLECSDEFSRAGFVSGHGFSRAVRIAIEGSALAAVPAPAEAPRGRARAAARLKSCPDTNPLPFKLTLTVVLLSTVILGVSAYAQQIQFRDITAQAGIHFTHNNGAFGKKYLPETMGPGCAFIDYDNDGWPDILITNGEGWPRSSDVRTWRRRRRLRQ